MSNAGFKLFGVQIDVGDESLLRKTKSLGNLQIYSGENNGIEASECLSDGARQTKKGKPWSEDEHISFLIGLDKLGKGDWKGISKSFVPSRNSSQVASHAQKYFIRMASKEKKRRRSSVFDIPTIELNRPSQEFPGSASNNATQTSQEPSMPVHVESPRLLPMTTRGIPDSGNMGYMQPRVSSFTWCMPKQTVMPTVSWVPVVNIPIQSSVCLPHICGNLGNCATFVPQPSVVTLRHQGSSSQPGSAITATNNR